MRINLLSIFLLLFVQCGGQMVIIEVPQEEIDMEEIQEIEINEIELPLPKAIKLPSPQLKVSTDTLMFYADKKLIQDPQVVRVTNATYETINVLDVYIGAYDKDAWGDVSGKCFTEQHVHVDELQHSEHIDIYIWFCNSTVSSRGILHIETSFGNVQVKLIGKIYNF
jgi:hypothetical protein